MRSYWMSIGIYTTPPFSSLGSGWLQLDALSFSRAQLGVPQNDRDYYRIGIGMDFNELIKVIKGMNPKAIVPDVPPSKGSQ